MVFTDNYFLAIVTIFSGVESGPNSWLKFFENPGYQEVVTRIGPIRLY